MTSPIDGLVVRPARTTDVRAIRSFIDEYSSDGRLLSKATVTLFEDVPEFLVAELDGDVVGCGAVHVMWEDLAEVRTLAVDPRQVGRGIGSVLLAALMERARDIGVKKVFCLTFRVDFFRAHGFVEIDDTRQLGVQCVSEAHAIGDGCRLGSGELGSCAGLADVDDVVGGL